MKLSDYVAQFLAQQSISHVYGVTGGAVVHLFNSIALNSEIVPIFTHHEQAASLAAVSHARVSGSLGAVIVTTGPGCTNAITGLLSAWQDSIPCIFISGQSRKEHTSHGTRLRQLGSQEFDIITLVKPVTKYAAMIECPESIRYHLEKAIYMAREGRPGPVWIDIPLNCQWCSIDPTVLTGFKILEDTYHCHAKGELETLVKKCLDIASHSYRPLILAGYGIRLSGAQNEFLQLINKLSMPVVASWTASDIIPSDHPLFIGRIGVAGQRGANLAVQNCDFLLCIGSHLSIPLTGTIFEAFAREANIVMVDIDQDELDFKTVHMELPIRCDARNFLKLMLELQESNEFPDVSSWRNKCSDYRKCDTIPSEWRNQGNFVNPYVFMDELSKRLVEHDIIVVDGGGTNLYISFQGLRTKEGQRLLLSSGICSMGTGLPESVGGCFASGKKRTVCLTGDGSLQFNIHELQTIVHHNLPIKVFVMNNQGYLAIRHTQKDFLDANFVGSCQNGGISLPDAVKIADAYGLKTCRIKENKELPEKLDWTLNTLGPVLCEVMVSAEQELIPRQGFKKNQDGTFSPRPLEDMCPFMEPDVLSEMMIVEPWPD